MFYKYFKTSSILLIFAAHTFSAIIVSATGGLGTGNYGLTQPYSEYWPKEISSGLELTYKSNYHFLCFIKGYLGGMDRNRIFSIPSTISSFTSLQVGAGWNILRNNWGKCRIELSIGPMIGILYEKQNWQDIIIFGSTSNGSDKAYWIMPGSQGSLNINYEYLNINLRMSSMYCFLSEAHRAIDNRDSNLSPKEGYFIEPSFAVGFVIKK
jgi:hypothetical protein